MDIGSIFLILALLILVGLFIARPIFERKAVIVVSQTSQDDHEFSTLLAERDRILNALQELDFDQALGKIPEEDYPAQRTLLLQQGASILRRLDQYNHRVPAGNAEERIEAAIAARRPDASRQGGLPSLAEDESLLDQGPTSLATSDDEVEARIAARRRERQGKSAGFCPRCGTPVQKSDLFCPKCGKQLT
ncbi:MAG TPA: zinc ribbon domain-containing protein [Anaerolineales bacterium]|nr:zinc ribbon domain-containing protein [Anaerolineales bacterium]